MRTRLVAALMMVGVWMLGACGARTSLDELLPDEEDASPGTTGSSSGFASSSGGATGSSGSPAGSGSSSGAGPFDGGHHDARVFDSGAPDVTTFDVEAPDVIVVETGPPDTGPPETGVVWYGGFCPVDAPDAGPGSCYTPDGVICEYGDNGSPYCDPIYSCTGHWYYESLLPQLCGAGTCPAAYADITEGASCATSGLDCGYAEGQCNCTSLVDGGAEGPLHWACFAPAGCPEPRPRIGTTCTSLGQVCDYGDCGGGVSETCTVLGWIETKAACVPLPPDGG